MSAYADHLASAKGKNMPPLNTSENLSKGNDEEEPEQDLEAGNAETSELTRSVVDQFRQRQLPAGK